MRCGTPFRVRSVCRAGRTCVGTSRQVSTRAQRLLDQRGDAPPALGAAQGSGNLLDAKTVKGGWQIRMDTASDALGFRLRRSVAGEVVRMRDDARGR